MVGTNVAVAIPSPDPAGAVYVMTNDAKANAVVAFARGANGNLQSQGTFATGGRGAGAGLGSQGALILNEEDSLLFAVNAGSNSISSFHVLPDGLDLIGAFSSGGLRPISLTVVGDLLYVLNAGGVANVTGFRVGQDGSLSRIGGSKQPLSNPMPNPAQVALSPSADLLLVTEKSTQLIDVYPVDDQGRAGKGATEPSAGIEPFGFAFDPAGHVLVSEAFNGGPGRSAVTSYQPDGTDLKVISPSVGTTQTAACWVVITTDGGHAFVTNTGSGTVSSYTIESDGSIALMEAVAGNSGPHSGPVDLDLTTDGHFTYVLNSGFGTISKFEVNGGDLSRMRQFGALPPGATGLAAR